MKSKAPCNNEISERKQHYLMMRWQKDLITKNDYYDGNTSYDGVISDVDESTYMEYEKLIGDIDKNNAIHYILKIMSPLKIQRYIDGNADIDGFGRYTFFDMIYFVSSLDNDEFNAWKHMAVRYSEGYESIMKDEAFISLHHVASGLFGLHWYDDIPDDFFDEDLRFAINDEYIDYIIDFCKDIKDRKLSWRIVRWFMSHTHDTMKRIQSFLPQDRKNDIIACISHSMSDTTMVKPTIPWTCSQIIGNPYIPDSYVAGTFRKMFDSYIDSECNDDDYQRRLEAISDDVASSDEQALSTLYRKVMGVENHGILVRYYNLSSHINVITMLIDCCSSPDDSVVRNVMDIVSTLDSKPNNTVEKAMRNDTLFTVLEHGLQYGKSMEAMLDMFHESIKRRPKDPDGLHDDTMNAVLFFMNWMESEYRDIPIEAYMEIMHINNRPFISRKRRI